MGLYCILQNVTTFFGITCRGRGCECIIYAQLILINLHIVTKFLCGRGDKIEYNWEEEDMIEVIEWSPVWILVIFNPGFAHDLVGILINILLMKTMAQVSWTPKVVFYYEDGLPPITTGSSPRHPFFYTSSHLSELQICKSIISTDFSFSFIFK